MITRRWWRRLDVVCGLAGTRGSACQTGCVSVSRARRTETVVYATTCATGRPTSASTAGTARPARRSATAACGTRTASASGRRRPSTDRSRWSAASVSARSDSDVRPVQSSRLRGCADSPIVLADRTSHDRRHSHRLRLYTPCLKKTVQTYFFARTLSNLERL